LTIPEVPFFGGGTAGVLYHDQEELKEEELRSKKGAEGKMY
jgi:hypothetical protein